MERKVKLDPFTYGAWDVATTIVQIGTAVAGIIMALNGNTAGLLALGSLAGGVRGNLLGDLVKAVSNGAGPPKGPGSLIIALAVVAILLSSCGTVSRQFIIDSQKAIAAEAGDYLTGCQQVTVAPAFSVDWNENVSFGGGLFAGCAENGRLVEFRCEGLEDTETGQTRLQCAPLSIWERTPEEQ